MKKGLIIITILFIITFFVNHIIAQEITKNGIKLGFNLASISGENVKDAKYRIGFSVGGFVTYSFNRYFAIQPEIYFTLKGYITEANDINTKINFVPYSSFKNTFSLYYLEIPVLTVFSVNRNLKLFTGSYFDIYLTGLAKLEFNKNTENFNPDTSSWKHDNKSNWDLEYIESNKMIIPGFGLVLGGEYVIGQISIGVRYSLGLSNVYKGVSYRISHHIIQFLVGFNKP